MAATEKATNLVNRPGVTKLRFPSWYDPDSPEVRERRRKLFAALEAEHSKEAVEAMDKLARASDLDQDLE